MAIRPPQLKSPPHLLCDWLEFKTLQSNSGRFRIAGLRRLWDVNRENEESDPEGLHGRESDTDSQGVNGNDETAFLDSIADEIGEREDSLGQSYPFRLSANGVLELPWPPTDGGYTYLFCLFLAHANGAELLDGTWYPDIDHRVRDLFQGCATLAAAAQVQGCAISFGWPRPNENPPFLQRLREVYALFGEGRVVDVARPGVSPCPKDEEIDVIAWCPRPDRAPGTVYLLGQVASGDNWEGKSIKGGPISSFHGNWFDQIPPSEPMAAVFIPHAVSPLAVGETRRERLAVITHRFGMVIDRLRLPLLTQQGTELARSGRRELVIERQDAVGHIANWVDAQMHALRVGAAQ